MLLRGAGAITALLVGLTGLAGSAGEAWSQYYPAQRAYPPAPYRQLPPLADTDDDDYEPFYQRRELYTRPLPRPAQTPPAQYGRPVPPAEIETYAAPPAPRYGRRLAAEESEPYAPAPPPGYIYRDAPPPQTGHIYRDGPPAARSYEPIEPSQRIVRPTPPAAIESQPPYGQSQPPYAQPPPAAATLPPAPADPQEANRPPMPVGPSEQSATSQPNPQDATGTVRDPRSMMSSLPPDYRPETGPKKELPPQFRRTLVDYRTKEPAGTIIIDTPATYLYLVLGNGKAMRYGVGVGRDGFTWSGVEKVTKMAEWPDWHPPEEMIERQPYLPRFMAGGEGNPLGARALYLGKTVYRIHGTNQPSTIGTFVSSGCIRLTNEDIADLYTRVKVGTRVKVLPGGKMPAQSASVPVAPQAAQPAANPSASALPPPPFVR